jgi:hypothetical protein
VGVASASHGELAGVCLLYVVAADHDAASITDSMKACAAGAQIALP